MSQTIVCSSCGAKNLLADNEDAILCSYCQNPLTRPAPEEVITHGTATQDHTSETATLLAYALRARSANNYDEATTTYNKVLEIDRYSAEAYFGRAYCYAWSASLDELDVDALIKDFGLAIKAYEDRLTPMEMTSRIVDEVCKWASASYDTSYQLTIDSDHPNQSLPLHIDRCEKLIKVLEWAHDIYKESFATIYIAVRICKELKGENSYKNSQNKSGVLWPGAEIKLAFSKKHDELLASIPYNDPQKDQLRKEKPQPRLRLMRYAIVIIAAILAFKGCQYLYNSGREQIRQRQDQVKEERARDSVAKAIEDATLAAKQAQIAKQDSTPPPKPQKTRKRQK